MIYYWRQQVAKMCAQVLLISDSDIINQIVAPPKPEMGDLAFPCFLLAKERRQSPPTLAQILCTEIQKTLSPDYISVTAIGPYVNFKLHPVRTMQKVFIPVFNDYLQNKPFKLGVENINSQKIVLEYSSPNIAKPMHVGHMRVTLVGATLDRILRFLGHNVVTINHIGDWGTQFGKLIVAYNLWGNENELQSRSIDYLVELYVRFHHEVETKPELDNQAREAFQQLESGASQIRSLWKRFSDLSYAEFEKIYQQLGVKFDFVLGESFYEDKMFAVMELLRQKNQLKTSEGAQIVDLEDVGLIPMIVQKSDGATIYATRDLAAAIYRAQTFKFDRMLYVVGTQQELHFKQLFAVLKKMGYVWADTCEHVKTGWFRFKGKSLSTRKGEVVLLKEVFATAQAEALNIIQEKLSDVADKKAVANAVGFGAVLFNELVSDPAKDVNFDFERVLDFSGDTGAYIQYTYARLSSILNSGSNIKPQLHIELLMESEWSDLAKHLGHFAEALNHCCQESKPMYLAQFTLQLSKKFNSVYLKLPILKAPTAQDIESRLAVVALTRHALKTCMELLGMPMLERM